MRALLLVLVAMTLYQGIVCPPVQKKAIPDKVDEGHPTDKEDDLGLEYERYLREVVNILEQDDSFRKKLESTNHSEIRSGEIAQHLELVHHSVRTKLDELKRQEVERLREITKVKHGKMNGMRIMNQELAKHVDHNNPEKFEIKDLEKLIKQATTDLEEIDKKRREEFKEYELEKEVEHRDKVKHLKESEKEAEEKHWKELKEKHKNHPKLNHPGSKDQLEEVWEKTDHMDKDNFDPKTFFKMHDINGDEVLDQEEVEALFERELAKAYDESNEEDDMLEKEEERNRMREHVFDEVDADQDGMISLEEFVKSTNADTFDKNEDWKTLDDEEIYTDEELAEFERKFQEEQAKHEQKWDDHAQGQAQPGVVQHPPDPSHIPPSQDHVQQQDHLQQQPGHQPGAQQMHQQPDLAAQQHQQPPVAGNQPPHDQQHEGQPAQGQGHAAPQVHDQAAAAEHQEQQKVVVDQGQGHGQQVQGHEQGQGQVHEQGQVQGHEQDQGQGHEQGQAQVPDHPAQPVDQHAAQQPDHVQAQPDAAQPQHHQP